MDSKISMVQYMYTNAIAKSPKERPRPIKQSKTVELGPSKQLQGTRVLCVEQLAHAEQTQGYT